jgi:hypothetical protein
MQEHSIADAGRHRPSALAAGPKFTRCLLAGQDGVSQQCLKVCPFQPQDSSPLVQQDSTGRGELTSRTPGGRPGAP